MATSGRAGTRRGISLKSMKIRFTRGTFASFFVLANILASSCFSIATGQERTPSPTLEKIENAERSSEKTAANGWRQFSDCLYKWDSWRLDASGRVRTTLTTCHPLIRGGAITESEAIAEVSVDCERAMIKEKIYPRYSTLVIPSYWEVPQGANKEMAIALCDNLVR